MNEYQDIKSLEHRHCMQRKLCMTHHRSASSAFRSLLQTTYFLRGLEGSCSVDRHADCKKLEPGLHALQGQTEKPAYLLGEVLYGCAERLHAAHGSANKDATFGSVQALQRLFLKTHTRCFQRLQIETLILHQARKCFDNRSCCVSRL